MTQAIVFFIAFSMADHYVITLIQKIIKKQPNFAELFKIDCDLKAVTKFPSYCDTIYTSSLFTLNIILSRVLDHGCLNSFLLLCGMFFSGSMKMNFSDFPVDFGKVIPQTLCTKAVFYCLTKCVVDIKFQFN